MSMADWVVFQGSFYYFRSPWSRTWTGGSLVNVEDPATCQAQHLQWSLVALRNISQGICIAYSDQSLIDFLIQDQQTIL